MQIAHVALWTDDLERSTRFYGRYFGATVTPRYVNESKGFESRFLVLDGVARIEVMRTSRLEPISHAAGAERMGLTHLAISVGTEAAVAELTERLRADGFPIIDEPRRTGDGYYESVVLDPDGNRLEITA